MPSIRYEIDIAPARKDVERLTAGLSAHAVAAAVGEGFHPLAVFARSPEGDLVGGAFGRINWTWLDVSLLWVSDDLRGQGLGSQLLDRLERAAAERGCTDAHVDTFSFQAPDFYIRAGYSVFATLPEYPPGHQRVYFRKSLEPTEQHDPTDRNEPAD